VVSSGGLPKAAIASVQLARFGSLREAGPVPDGRAPGTVFCNVVAVHTGHHSIRPTKRDWLVMFNDERCSGNQQAESRIQVGKQRFRDRVEQLTLQRGQVLVP
jgi:hypothetical protein